METSTKLLLAGAAAVGAYFLFCGEKKVVAAPAPLPQPIPLPPPPPPKVTTLPGGISVPFSPDRPEVQAVLNTLKNSPEAMAAAQTAAASPEAAAVANVLKAIPGFSF